MWLGMRISRPEGGTKRRASQVYDHGALFMCGSCIRLRSVLPLSTSVSRRGSPQRRPSTISERGEGSGLWVMPI